MARDGRLRLRVVDAYGEFIQEKVEVTLRNQALSDQVRLTELDVSREVVIGNLLGPPNNLYLTEIVAPSYRPVRRFLSTDGRAGQVRQIRLPIDARKVVRVDFPAYGELGEATRALLERSGAVLGQGGHAGQDLYLNLDPIRRAGLLNILAKTGRTLLANGRSVLSYLAEEGSELLEIRGDRFFAAVPKELREEVKHSVADETFEPAPDTLHTPPKGFSRAGSFKTRDTYGNLQLTFFARGNRWVADIDIDDAAGLEHVFQVVRNALTGAPTHPYDIHQILLVHQELDSGYRLRTAAPA
jgi:hypothetical protein